MSRASRKHHTGGGEWTRNTVAAADNTHQWRDSLPIPLPESPSRKPPEPKQTPGLATDIYNATLRAPVRDLGELIAHPEDIPDAIGSVALGLGPAGEIPLVIAEFLTYVRALRAGAAAGATASAGAGAVAAEALPPLRQAYVDAVAALKPLPEALHAAGADDEAIARALHAARREIGEHFKELTPPDKLAELNKRNLQKYGDKLGPTIEWFRARGKSWNEITESATRSGGNDLGF